jgi:hypothetical protein
MPKRLATTVEQRRGLNGAIPGGGPNAPVRRKLWVSLNVFDDDPFTLVHGPTAGSSIIAHGCEMIQKVLPEPALHTISKA